MVAVVELFVGVCVADEAVETFHCVAAVAGVCWFAPKGGAGAAAEAAYAFCGGESVVEAEG